MMLSKNIREQIIADDNGTRTITIEEIENEAVRLGLPVLEIIRLLFDFLTEYRFPTKGY